MSNKLPPLPADEADAMIQAELDAIRTLFLYYRLTDPRNAALPRTRHEPLYRSGWASNDNHQAGIYYRTIVQWLSAAAVVLLNDPEHPAISLSQVLALYTHVMSDYRMRQGFGGGGWGFPVGFGDPTVLPFQGTAICACATVTAGLLWPLFEESQRALTRDVLADMADRYVAVRDAQYFTDRNTAPHLDTMTENASADASFLATVSQFYRGHPNSQLWLQRAGDLFAWAYAHYLRDSTNSRRLVSAHRLFYHPMYGLSTPNDTGIGLVPWVAQGIGLEAATGIEGISSIAPGTPNSRLYGYEVAQGAGRIALFEVLGSQMEYVRGAPVTAGPLAGIPLVPATSDFTLQGIVRNGSNQNVRTNYRSMSYQGVVGVSDWGCGLDFQNSAYASGWLLDKLANPIPNNAGANFRTLQGWQRRDRGYAYHTSLAPQATWGYLRETCASNRGMDVSRVLVRFYDPLAPHTPCSRTNSHFFLNTFKAWNHVAAYLLTRGGHGRPVWPASADNKSTLPDFSRS
jgi:hypothetical protein